MMRTTYDPAADALSVRLWEPGPRQRVYTRAIGDGVSLDYTKDGRLVGLEVLGASDHLPASALDALASAEELLTLVQAAAASGLEAATLRGLINRQRLRGQKRGRDWLVSRADLLTYLESRGPRGRPAKSAAAGVTRKGPGMPTGTLPSIRMGG